MSSTSREELFLTLIECSLHEDAHWADSCYEEEQKQLKKALLIRGIWTRRNFNLTKVRHLNRLRHQGWLYPSKYGLFFISQCCSHQCQKLLSIKHDTYPSGNSETHMLSLTHSLRISALCWIRKRQSSFSIFSSDIFCQHAVELNNSTCIFFEMHNPSVIR